MRGFAVLLCVLLLVVAVGCGSSGPGSASRSTSTAATGPGTTTSATGATTATTTATTTQTAPLTANGTPPTAPDTNPPTAPSRTSTPPSDVRLPATFTILPNGALSPPTVTAPARIPVLVTVVSGDGRAHHAVLRTRVPHELAVPAHGRASVFLTGLEDGRYALDIDGAPKGALVVGGAPGP
ncbi:MAG: hypothetical protein JO325_22055 [Solirubrobacterales bacterium]|nr:hypothetical protein [Solirubrobacterales bacterium]